MTRSPPKPPASARHILVFRCRQACSLHPWTQRQPPMPQTAGAPGGLLASLEPLLMRQTVSVLSPSSGASLSSSVHLELDFKGTPPFHSTPNQLLPKPIFTSKGRY